MKLSADDISAHKLRMRDGERDAVDIQRNVQTWIKAHRKTYDSQVAAARAAAKS